MILVTGAAGFIGSNLVHKLVSLGHRVIGFDAFLIGGSYLNLIGIDQRQFTIVRGDLREEDKIRRVFKDYEIDTIYHLSAESISESEIIPVHTAHTIQHKTFKELWNHLLPFYSVNIIGNNPLLETIDLTNKTDIKCLTYINGMGEFRRVKQISRHWYKGKMVKIRQKWGIASTTPNHSLLNHLMQCTQPSSGEDILAVRKLNWYPQKVLDYVELSLTRECPNISKKEDELKIFKGKTSIKKILHHESLKNFMSFGGAFVAEGWASYNKANGSYIIGIANNDKSWLEDKINKARSFSTSKWSLVQRKDGGYQATTSSKTFYILMKKYFGAGHLDKHLPDWIYFLNPKIQEEFLLSSCQGDGSLICRKRDFLWKYTSTSYKLQCQMSLLYTILKKDYSVYEKRTKEYSASYDLVEVKHYQKNQGKNSFYAYDYEGWVYDLSIEETQNFAVGIGNLIAHNTHVDRSISNDKSFWESNVIGTTNLFRCVKDHPEVKKIINQVTDEVFGPKERGASLEGDRLLPTSPYASSKAAQYLVGKSYERTFQLPIVSTFPSNTYGPRQYPEKLIPKFINRLLKDEKVPLMKSSHFQRDWLAVEDHVNALIFLMDHGLIGEDYNIPGNSLLTNLVITEHLLSLLDKGPEFIEEVPDRKAHDCRYCVDGTKLKELGWVPKLTMEDYLPETVIWYKKQLEEFPS
jgi:dTDP-glucose 4,6-dehydratase